MARSSEDAGDTFSMDFVPRASSDTLAPVGSDNSSLTEGDLAILNRLQFLAEKVELLGRKLDNTLHNVRGSDGDLAENFAQDYSVINSFQVNVLTGPSCKQNDYSLDDDAGDSSSLMTRETWENAETELNTSFLIIPVGNNREQGVCTLQSENQTLLAPETDLALPECITSEEGECSMIVRPSVGTSNLNNFNPKAILPALVHPATAPVSDENSEVFSKSPNQTMFSTASIELANCLRSRPTHPDEQQTGILSCLSEDSGLAPDNLSVSPNLSANSVTTYGYTIGLATARGQGDGGYSKRESRITDTTVALDQHQYPEEARSLVLEETERESRRSTVEFTPNSNRKFQCRDAITETERHDLLSEVTQMEGRFADKSINSDLQLSKRHSHEAEVFIDSSNVREASHFEKPRWLPDANRNYVASTGVLAVTERADEKGLYGGRIDGIMNEVEATGKTDNLITNGSNHYKRFLGNYDLSKSGQIDMQTRYTASQRPEVAWTQPQAADHSTNNARSETVVNTRRMPAVYNGGHCVNGQASASDQSMYSDNEALTAFGDSDAKDSAVFRYTSPHQRNKRAGPAHVNGGAKTLQTAGSATKTATRDEFTAHEQSFEKHLRRLIDPESIGPTPVPEKPLRPLLSQQVSSERGSLVVRSTAMQRNLVAEKERRFAGSYRSYPTTGYIDSSSDSPYSSRTSVSSTLELGQSAETSGPSIDTEYSPRNAISPRNARHDEFASNSSSVSYNKTDFYSASESEAFRSFRLFPLSLNQRFPAPPPHCVDNLSRCNYENSYQLSSPTSSLDTSELSVIDSITECQCQHECECQTGIPSEEDFIKELKTISKSVLNARQKANTTSKTHARYFLDEEQSEMDMIGAHLREHNRPAVPMLVKVILRLRKHFFGTADFKSPATVRASPRSPPKSKDESIKRRRRITFSPSAVLLSAIGENSASEVKEVIEKEKLDVNVLSPSGRSLLHKASAAGDLESIHTLVQHGARVNILDQDGFPPLHSALRKAHYKCAIFLIECGADLNGYTTGCVQEFLDITQLAETYLKDEDHEQDLFYGTMLNTAL